MRYKQNQHRSILHFIVMPVIYSLIIPIVILDIWIEIYHRICFAAYGIPYVKRGKYVKIDRHKLQYLKLYEKFNCMYCGYANGLLQYSCVIAGETEKYWCGIKHQLDEEFCEPQHHAEFIPYGDEDAYKKLG